MTADMSTTSSGLDLADLLPSWRLSLRAKNVSDRTIDTYDLAARQFIDYLRENKLPTEADRISRHHVRGFLDGVLASRAPATAKQRYGSLLQLFKWLEDEEEIDSSPMHKVKPPKVPEQPVPVLEREQLTRLLTSVKGNDFDARRDAAILYLFADTGMRLGEMEKLRTDDLDLEMGVAIVRGKGAKIRSVPFGRKTAQKIDRYLRARRGHKDAHLPWLWLGLKGRLSDSGIHQMVKRRARAIGLDLHVHIFRHSFAHHWLAAGGQEGDLQRIAGWADRQMLNRYGASAATQRALDAHQRFSPVERL